MCGAPRGKEIQIGYKTKIMARHRDSKKGREAAKKEMPLYTCPQDVDDDSVLVY